MSPSTDRRTLIRLGLAFAAGTSLGVPLASCHAQSRRPPRFGPRREFSFATVEALAAQLAGRPPRSPERPSPDIVASMDYDAMSHVAFRREDTIWRSGNAPVRLFPMTQTTPSPVRIHLVDGRESRELLYRPSLFRVDPSFRGGEALPADYGFGGFRVMHGPGEERDWLAFAGASYFRSAGPLDQYGLSARGIAIGTGQQEPEEFPRFSQFWLSEGGDTDDIQIWALLEGESLTGAYAMTATRGSSTVMQIQASLFPRREVRHLGLAPLTSMYWFSETNRRHASDWRPEIHDSDGLAIETGRGERLWRPLLNPSRVRTSSFVDESPKGFGLLQRDRNFDHYQDDGVFYEKRPSVWVEPEGDWGRGAVQLVEIPTDDEIYDNVVAFWAPGAPLEAGESRRFRYVLSWEAEHAERQRFARVVATRRGAPGVPGHPRPDDGAKLVLDFEGPTVANLGRDDGVEPVVSASGGRLDGIYGHPVVGTSRYRAVFDVFPETGAETVELRCFLRQGTEALSETWTVGLDASSLTGEARS